MKPDPNKPSDKQRMLEARAGAANWKLWGPYVSERQWVTVREDYTATGAAWGFLSYDGARSRAYRCGEDGTSASVVSKLEAGGDVKVSTLQRYCAAIGEKWDSAQMSGARRHAM